MRLVDQYAPLEGVAATCAAVGLPRATYYRRKRPKPAPQPRPAPPRALTPDERAHVLDVLHAPEHVDLAPAEVYAKLLDAGEHLCSPRTMYRVLAAAGEVRERRDQLVHPEYKKPELLATGPNQVWSWDITKLLGPAKWTYFYLYVVLDIFSRYVVGWMVADRENAAHARRLLAETYARHDVEPGTLTLHQDRGAPMRAKTFAQLLADLGVTKSHSRPHVSDDNPFSEAQFKTLKYRPDFPGRFDTRDAATAYHRGFFDWYNHEHHHEALGLLTPADVHLGRAPAVVAARQRVLDAAYAANPERFVHGPPTASAPPTEVWINKPATPPAPHDQADATATATSEHDRPRLAQNGPQGDGPKGRPEDRPARPHTVEPCDNASSARSCSKACSTSEEVLQ
jgi:putative transposase